MRHRMWAAALVAAAVAFAAGRAFSQEGEKKEGAADPEMEAWMKFHAPGKEHEILKQMVGEWGVEAKVYHAPGQEPEAGTGTATLRSVLGGRFVLEEYDQTSGSGSFQGVGLFGYDNQKKKYTSVWADSMSTAAMFSEGDADAAGKTTTLVGKYLDPEGKTWTWRSVTTFVDADTFTYDGYTTGPDGAESKGLEIRYTRKK